jgi:hypothetical protein
MGFGWLDEGAEVSVYLADGDQSDWVEVTGHGALKFDRENFKRQNGRHNCLACEYIIRMWNKRVEQKSIR